MPLTIAHPAAVLPLRRTTLPMTALVLGAMVPDVPIFTGWHGYRLTHSWTGVITVDVVMTCVVVAVWFVVLRDAMVALSPQFVRRRLPRHAQMTTRYWLLVPPAAAVGAATHVVWDSFTHRGRWGVEQIQWLAEPHGALTGSKWVQYGSSVVGLVLLAAACARYLADRPSRDLAAQAPWVQRLLLPLVVVAAVAYSVAELPRGPEADPRSLAWHGAVNGISALAVGVFAVGLMWHLSRLSAALQRR